MSTTIPLFPLGSVLFPGLVLPLHIFEERYRQLVADLQAGPQPGQFGIVAIRHGRETGIDGVSALYDVGCLAEVRRVDPHEDGRFDLIAVGTQRFKLRGLGDQDPYFSGDVEFLTDEAGPEDETALLVPAVQRAFRSYLDELTSRGGAQVTIPELPDEPVLLSYLVAAAVVVDLPVKQRLLEEPDARRRLMAERTLLAREIQMLKSLTAAPAPDLRNSPYSQN
jgi:Lon protease-like protein